MSTNLSIISIHDNLGKFGLNIAGYQFIVSSINNDFTVDITDRLLYINHLLVVAASPIYNGCRQLSYNLYLLRIE